MSRKLNSPLITSVILLLKSIAIVPAIVDKYSAIRYRKKNKNIKVTIHNLSELKLFE